MADAPEDENQLDIFHSIVDQVLAEQVTKTLEHPLPQGPSQQVEYFQQIPAQQAVSPQQADEAGSGTLATSSAIDLAAHLATGTPLN